MMHFYPTPKMGGTKHDFLVTLNVPVGVHVRVKNLLTRIGIRDLLFCNMFLRFLFHIFLLKDQSFKNIRESKSNYKQHILYIYII